MTFHPVKTMASTDSAGDERVETKSHYFRTPGLLWIVVIPLGLALLIMSIFRPDLLPYNYLGPLGRLTQFLVKKHPDVLKGILGMAIILHFVEAVFAFRVARSKNIDSKQTWMWSFQTLLYGMPSLKYLLSYKPDKLKK